MRKRRTKIVVIVGPTASGKSDLAVRFARQFNGEVVSADSRQVYTGLNIGTGKITKREMRDVRHHLLDVASPQKQFTVVDYIEKARQAIDDIAQRGKLPIVCGGTGFYISALLGEQTLSKVPPNHSLREILKKKTVAELLAMLKKINPKRASAMNDSDRKNSRRLMRAIEIARSQNKTGQQSKNPKYDALKIGLKIPGRGLRKKISMRLFARIRAGMVAEARHLHKKGLSWKRMEELGLEYRCLAKYLKNQISKAKMIEKLDTEIWRYAKRQKTWFKRDKKITWFSPSEFTHIQKSILKFLRTSE